MIYCIIIIIAIIVVIIINSSKTILIRPVYLSSFINKQINYKTKEINKHSILIDDDGLDSLSLEDLKKRRKEENLILFYVKFLVNNSYLYTVFKDNYIIICRKISKVYKSGDFIVVKNNHGNYYIREVYSDDRNNKVAVFNPERKDFNIEYINRMNIVGEVINYNKYRIDWI
jgi:hypothetical protein